MFNKSGIVMKFKSALLLSSLILFFPKQSQAGENLRQQSDTQFTYRLLSEQNIAFFFNTSLLYNIRCSSTEDCRGLESAIRDPQSRTRESIILDEIRQERKSTFLAVVYSLVLPGMGELYAERFDVGKYSLIAEVGLWLTYTGFQLYGTWLQDDARAFAVTHAGINPNGKDDQFYVNVGNFLNTYDYNDKKLRDRDPGKVYNDPSYFWQWDSDANRARFRDLRVSADNVFNNSRFVIAAVIINHIISAINAARLTSKYNTALETRTSSFEIRASVLGGFMHPDGIVITLQKNF